MGVPGGPTGLRADPGPGSVTLNWSEPVFNGGAAITGYRYRHRTSADSGENLAAGNWTGWFSAGTDTKVEIAPLDPGVEYDFEVTASNSAGTGPASETTGTPAATAPTGTPSLTVVLAKDSGNEDNREQIRIEYRTISDSANGGDPIAGYELQWKADDGEWAGADSTSFDPATPTGLTQDTLITRYHPRGGNAGDDLSPGTTYTYRVRAYNGADGDETDGQSPLDREDDGTLTNPDQIEENGPWSAERSVKTVAVAPSTPALNPINGAQATQSTPALEAWTRDINSITVRWAEPADGGSPITSYQLEVRNDPGGDEDNTFTMVNPDEPPPNIDRSDNTRISNLPASRTWFTHTGLKAESTYYYRIRALNDADGDGRPGEEGEVSEWSGASEDAITRDAMIGTHAAPANVAATAGTVDADTADQIVLRWTPPAVPSGETGRL